MARKPNSYEYAILSMLLSIGMDELDKKLNFELLQNVHSGDYPYKDTKGLFDLLNTCSSCIDVFKEFMEDEGKK